MLGKTYFTQIELEAALEEAVTELDSTVVNCWKIYNMVNETKMSQVEIKCYLALRMMKCENRNEKEQQSQPIDEIRFEKNEHIGISHDLKTHRRCKVCKNTQSTCARSVICTFM
jgi:hypothetical protein